MNNSLIHVDHVLKHEPAGAFFATNKGTRHLLILSWTPQAITHVGLHPLKGNLNHSTDSYTVEKHTALLPKPFSHERHNTIQKSKASIPIKSKSKSKVNLP
jgi:hypothetical protein